MRSLEKTYMFYIFDWFISSHTHIFISLNSCARDYIIASSHPHIIKFIGVSLYTRILASSYSQIHVCLLLSSHPQILVSSSLCVLAGTLKEEIFAVRTEREI